KTRHSIDRSSTSVASLHGLFSAAFITNIAEFESAYRMRFSVHTLDRQARDQAEAGHLLSCLAGAKACANTGIKHEAAAAAPAAAGGRARAARNDQAPAECRHRLWAATQSRFGDAGRRARVPSQAIAARDACRRNRGARRSSPRR